ncbi:MAG: GntR family transcriptional regulator [Alphaproteobacteria bacterium]|nr:GntR family transcriptional regulator [Alphaproteobacteria bacterium]
MTTRPLSIAPAPVAVAERLRAAILTGTLAAGTRINQDRIAATHGISHIPVREALRRLEAEGLVTFAPRRGFFVARLDAADAAELGEMRAALEALAIRLAVPNLAAADLAAAAAAIEAAERTPSLAAWSDCNWRFHRALYAPCARPRLMETLETLWRGADRYLRVVWQAADWQGRSQSEHRAILTACRERDGDRAAALVADHVAAATAALVTLLREDSGDENKTR